MDIAGKHYYQAVIFYYIANNYQKALESIYNVLKINSSHSGALKLAKKLKKKDDKPQHTEDIETEIFLNLLDNNEYENFLVNLLSKDETGHTFLSSIK